MHKMGRAVATENDMFFNREIKNCKAQNCSGRALFVNDLIMRQY